MTLFHLEFVIGITYLLNSFSRGSELMMLYSMSASAACLLISATDSISRLTIIIIQGHEPDLATRLGFNKPTGSFLHL